MGKPYIKIGHSCGTKSGLQTFEEDDGTYNGWCFACSTYVAEPFGDNPPRKQEVAKNKISFNERMQELSDLKLKARNIESRGIRAETLKHYKCFVGLSQQDGKTPDVVYFPYFKGDKKTPSRVKVRILEPKKMFSYSNPAEKDVDLFGWRQFLESGGRKLYITEGEFDALALREIFSRFTDTEKYDLPTPVSLPNGAGNAKKSLADLRRDILDVVNEGDIVLVFDQDEPGQKAVKDVLGLFPRASVATLPKKDANECLHHCPKRAWQAVTFQSGKAKNSRLIAAETLHESAKEKPKFGVSWPWPKLTQMTRGIRLGETIYVGAGAKMGKSEVVNALAAHLVKEHKWKIMLAKPEESNNKTYKMLASKVVSKVFHDPSVEFDEEAYDRAGEILKGKVLMLNLFQHVGWETLQGDIRAAAAEGCKAVFLDPITNLTNGMDSATANIKLQEISQELSSLALDLGIVVFIFCHLRNPDNGPDHSNGGKVLASQFAGSRAMERSCNYMFGLEGNRSPDQEDGDKNMRSLVLLSDREFGEVGSISLYWDANTHQFNEM